MNFAEVSENGIAENLDSAVATQRIKVESAKVKSAKLETPEQSEAKQIKDKERQMLIIADMEKTVARDKKLISLFTVITAICICTVVMLSIFWKNSINAMFIFASIVIVVINIIILSLWISGLKEHKKELKTVRHSLSAYDRMMRQNLSKMINRHEGFILGLLKSK